MTSDAIPGNVAEKFHQRGDRDATFRWDERKALSGKRAGSGVGNLGTESMSDVHRVAAEMMGVSWEQVVVSWDDTTRDLPWTRLGRQPDACPSAFARQPDPRALGARHGTRARQNWVYDQPAHAHAPCCKGYKNPVLRNLVMRDAAAAAVTT